jgi:hypothetical protein
LILAGVLVCAWAGIASAAAHAPSGPRTGPFKSVTEQLQCPPPPAPGWRIDNDAAFRGEIVPGIAGSFHALCQYERDDSFATVSMDVAWWPGANPPTGPAGFCGRQETTTGTTALRQSPQKAAYIQVGDSSINPVGLNQLLAAGQPLLAQAEQRAAPCAPAQGGLTCPPALAGIPVSTFGGGGSPAEKPGGGTFVLLCRYIAASGAVANLELEWDQAAKTPHSACGHPRLDTTGGGVPSAVIYSQTKAAHLTVLGAAASVTEMVRAGEPLLAAVEPLAVPCPERPAEAVPTVAAAGGPDAAAGETGSDDLYREGTVPDDGLASAVLEPGSDLPNGGEAAAAAAVATGVVAAGAAVQASRSGRRRSPAAGLPGVVQDRLASERDRAVMEALARKGITPPLVAAIGGPGRVVRLGTRFVRNPVRATGDFLKDTFHNLTHPKDMFRHVRNGVRRVVESSPAGPVVNLLSRLFRRRPRGPRGPQLSSQRISDAVVEPGRGLQSAPEKPPTFEEMYGQSAPDLPSGEGKP